MRLAALITYHNEKHLLTACLDSLQANSRLPDEILVYDDASAHPPEPHIPSGLAVRVIRGSENQGPARARNQLLNATSCDYVHFHDSDDAFHPDWCQEVSSCLDSFELDAVFTEITSYMDGKLLSEHVLGLAALEQDGDLTRFCIRGAMLVPAGTYRRRKLLDIGGYATDLWQSEDYDFHIRLAASSLQYRIIQKALIKINIRAESRSQNRLDVFTDQVKVLKRLTGVLPPAYHQDVADALAGAGGSLYKMGALAQAREAFHSATRIAQPRFAGQRQMYRFLAKRFGQESAERMGKYFRLAMPETLRRLGRQ